MPARFEVTFRTLSKRPFWHIWRPKWFVEGDQFAYEITITNDGKVDFPPEEMWVKVSWTFPGISPRHVTEMRIPTRSLKPGDHVTSETATVKVMAPGFCALTLDYGPFDAHERSLHDSSSRIYPVGGEKVVADFRGFSTVELETIYGLLFAGVAALLAVLALLLR